MGSANTVLLALSALVEIQLHAPPVTLASTLLVQISALLAMMAVSLDWVSLHALCALLASMECHLIWNASTALLARSLTPALSSATPVLLAATSSMPATVSLVQLAGSHLGIHPHSVPFARLESIKQAPTRARTAMLAKWLQLALLPVLLALGSLGPLPWTFALLASATRTRLHVIRLMEPVSAVKATLPATRVKPA